MDCLDFKYLAKAGVLLGDGVQSNEDVYKMKNPLSTDKYHIK